MQEIDAVGEMDFGKPSIPEGLVVTKSPLSAPATVARLKVKLANAGVPVFAVVDHAANAASVGEDLRPTTVMIFGNPQVGTKLMQQNQVLGLDLPLRILVWEDEVGLTWVGYHSPASVIQPFGISNAPIVASMQTFLKDLFADAATDPSTRQ